MNEPLNLNYFEQFPKEQRKSIIAQHILSYYESHRENLELLRDKNHPFHRDAVTALTDGTSLSQEFLASPYAEKQPISVIGAATRLASMNHHQAAIKSRPRGVIVRA